MSGRGYDGKDYCSRRLSVSKRIIHQGSYVPFCSRRCTFYFRGVSSLYCTIFLVVVRLDQF